MPEDKNRRFGLIGTITRDVITQASGRIQSGLGGILYHGAGLCALDQDVTLFANVARDLLPQVRSLVDRWPTFDGTEVEAVSGPGNRVFLHYPEEGERVEVLESCVPPLRPDGVLANLPRTEFLILVMNSGFDITLPDWRRIVSRARCPLWFDVHSLALTRELHAARRYRSLPDWREWAEGVTYLQANRMEVGAMLGEKGSIPSGERLLRFGEAALDLGIEGVFITLGAEGVLVMKPGFSGKLASPGSGEVVDTTGCGDIFCAGTAALLSTGADPVEAARFGAELASEAAGVSGIDETYSLIRKRSFYA